MNDTQEEFAPIPKERSKKPTPMPRAKSVPNFGDVLPNDDIINHISFNFPINGRKSDDLCEQERNENNDIKQFVINNDYNKEEPIYDNLPVKVETIILPDIIKNKLTEIDNATNEILIRLEESNEAAEDILPPIPPKLLDNVEIESLINIDDPFNNVTKEIEMEENEEEICSILQDVKVGNLIEIDDFSNDSRPNNPALLYYSDRPLIAIESSENTTDDETIEPVLDTFKTSDIKLNTDSTTALLEESIAIIEAKISDLDDNNFVSSVVCEKYQSYDSDHKYNTNSDEEHENQGSNKEQEEILINFPSSLVEDNQEIPEEPQVIVGPLNTIGAEIIDINKPLNQIVTRISEIIPPTEYSESESDSQEETTTKNTGEDYENDDDGIYEAPPPPVPLRKTLIPKEVLLQTKSVTLNRDTPAVSHHHSLKKSFSSWSLTSTSSDTSVKKKFSTLKKFITSVGRSHSEILLKKKKSSDLIVSSPPTPVKLFEFERPRFDRVDVSIRHSGILIEVHQGKRIEWRVTLDQGILSWISDWGENSLNLENITSITAISSVGPEWSHGVSICYVSGSPIPRVRSFSCRSEAERDTWLGALLGAATAAFPARLTRQFTRAGWLHVKVGSHASQGQDLTEGCTQEETGAPWQPSWMLLTENHVAYCEESGGLRELDLRNAMAVVSQRQDLGTDTRIVITIELHDHFLYLRAPNELETNQWEKYLNEALLDHDSEKLQPDDDVTEEVGVAEGADIVDGVVEDTAGDDDHSDEESKERSVVKEVGVIDSPPTTQNTIARNRSATDMFVCVHIEMYASAITVQVALGPHTTAGEVCSELGRGEDHMLQEFVLGGALARPLHASERVLEVVMRWGDWDLNYRRDNQLVLATSQIYAESKQLLRPRMTASGKLKAAVGGSKSFRSVWMELCVGAIRLYKKETSSTELEEWKVNDLVWYLGHEAKRDPGTKWTITFIKKEEKQWRTKDQPYFGTTFGGSNKDDLVQWCAAFFAAAYPEGL